MENNNTSWEGDVLEVMDPFEEEQKPKPKKSVVYAILAVIALGAAIWFIARGASALNFDNWTEHTEGAVTVRIPTTRITEEREGIPDVPDIYILGFESSTRAAEVGVMRTTGFRVHNLPASVMEELAYGFMTEGAMALVDSYSTSTGTMQGLSFENATGLHEDRNPFEFRAFVINNEVYIVWVIVSGENNIDIIDQFFDAMEIHR